MSGVKANIARTSHPADAAGRPVANAGQNEPSIDDILASIRQIISDQNRQADHAAEKAAAEVANKAPVGAKVESIIGAVAADHWNDRADTSASSRAPGIAPQPARTSSNPSELEELIQLIGATPPAPSPTKQAMWIDPKSKNTLNTKIAVGSPASRMEKSPAPVRNKAAVESKPGPAQPVRFETPANVATAGPGAIKPAVILPANPATFGQSDIAKQEINFEPRLHPSVLPKTVVPQLIKEAIARPLAKTVAANSQSHISQAHTPQASPVQRPGASPKSALDRLIARKAGSTPVVEAPVQQVVAPRAIAPASTQQQKPLQATPAAGQKSAEPTRSNSSPIANTANPTQKNVSNSPAISSQAVNAAVVKSIERLATSMFSDRKEEIDGMMAGIVRPMLQDWLEDNLPSLVERIVREEIERVSRGTHQ